MTTPPPATLTLLRTIIRLSCTSNHGVPQVNVNTMTTDAIRDELARREGWTPTEHGWMNDEETVNDHPIPATLDEALRLPPGWTWCRNRTHGLYAIHDDRTRMPVRVSNSGDILQDAFRLNLACTLAAVGHKEDALRTLTESEPKPCP